MRKYFLTLILFILVLFILKENQFHAAVFRTMCAIAVGLGYTLYYWGVKRIEKYFENKCFYRIIVEIMYNKEEK